MGGCREGEGLMLGGANPYPRYEGACSKCRRSHKKAKLYWDTARKQLRCGKDI